MNRSLKISLVAHASLNILFSHSKTFNVNIGIIGNFIFFVKKTLLVLITKPEEILWEPHW